MEKVPNARRSSTHLTAAQWQQVVNLYERGHGPMARIAERYGVSRQAIWAGLKKHGAVKDCRLEEHTLSLIADLDREAIRRRHIELARHDAWIAEARRHDVLIGKLMAGSVARSDDEQASASSAKLVGIWNVP